MQDKRKFYIIAHNPNSVTKAMKCLRDGANALEPDVQYDQEVEGHFYISEFPDHDPTARDRKPTLKKYLSGLIIELAKPGAPDPPALIAFDLKPPYIYDLNELYLSIRLNFSKKYPGIAILTTVSTPSGMDFLAQVEGRQHPNEAIGVDENASPFQLVERFRSRSLSYAYANGSTPFDPSKFLHYIVDAIPMRDDTKTGLDLVYAWTDKYDRRMLDFLNKEIDGLITDDVVGLKKLIMEDPNYSQRFTLAKLGYNPFHNSLMV